MELPMEWPEFLLRTLGVIILIPVAFYLLRWAHKPVTRAMPERVRRLGKQAVRRKRKVWYVAGGICAAMFGVGIFVLIVQQIVLSLLLLAVDFDGETFLRSQMPFLGPLVLGGLIGAMFCGARYQRLNRFVKQFMQTPAL